MVLRILLFVFFLSQFLFSQNNIPHMQMVGIPISPPDEYVALRDDNGRYCAAIIINSDMEGFQYQSNNGVVKVDDQPGKDIVYVSPDEQVLEILKEGYQPLKIVFVNTGIELEPKKVWVVQITADESNLVTVNFLIEPYDTDIFIDNKPRVRGSTFKLVNGRHRIKLSKKGYITQWNEIIVNKNNALFKFTLEKYDGVTFKIETEPKKAYVFLNKRFIGSTPLMSKQPFGEYNLIIYKKGYEKVRKSIDMRNNPDFEIKVKLKSAGYINVRTTPVKAEVWVDSALIGATPINTEPIRLGKHTLKIVKKNYQDIVQNFTINDTAESQTFRFDLKKRQSLLSVSGSPQTAEIYWDDNKIGQIPLKRFKAEYGTHHLNIERAGYHPLEKDIIVQQEQMILNDINLLPKSRAFAFFSSTIIPGSGQFYAGEKSKGFLLGLLTFGGAAYSYFSYQNYLNLKNDYLNSKDKYLANVDSGIMDDLRNDMNSKWDGYKKARDIRNISIAATAVLWAYNIFDAIVFFPQVSKLNVQANINKHKKAVSLGFLF